MADPVSLTLGIAGVAAPVFKFSTVGASRVSKSHASSANWCPAIHFILDIKNVPKDQEYLVFSCDWRNSDCSHVVKQLGWWSMRRQLR